MTRKLKYGIFALLLGWSCTEIAAQPRLPEVDPKVKEDPMFQLQKLNQFYRYLNGTYVDTLHNDQLVDTSHVVATRPPLYIPHARGDEGVRRDVHRRLFQWNRN